MTFRDTLAETQANIRAVEDRRQTMEQATRNALEESSILKHSLGKAALDAIAVSEDVDAWEFMRTGATYSTEMWAIVQDRLPRLLALRTSEDEIYMRIHSHIDESHGDYSSEVSLSPANQLAINADDNIEIDGCRSIEKTLPYPAPRSSWRTPYSEYRGALLGHAEVGDFLKAIQDDPTNETLLYHMALAFTTSEHAMTYWHTLPDALKGRIINRCFELIKNFPHSNPDKYAPETVELPQAIALVAIEANVRLDMSAPPIDLSDAWSQMATWRVMNQYPDLTDGEKFEEKVWEMRGTLSRAYYSWRNALTYDPYDLEY